MIRPFPSPNSVARLTLFPRPPSSSSTVGIESPGLTMVAVVCGSVGVCVGEGETMQQLEMYCTVQDKKKKEVR